MKKVLIILLFLPLFVFSQYDTTYYSVDSLFNNNTTYLPVVAKLTDSKFVIAYRTSAVSLHGVAKIGNYSDTTITSFGDEYTFNNYNISNLCIAVIDTNKFIVAYQDKYGSDNGCVALGTVNGSVITFQDSVIFSSGQMEYISISTINDTSVVVVYSDETNSDYGTANIITLSGTTLTPEGEYVFLEASADFTHVSTMTDTSFIVSFNNASTDTRSVAGYIASDYSIAYGDQSVFQVSQTSVSSAKISDTKFTVTSTGSVSNSLQVSIGNLQSDSTITFTDDSVFVSTSLPNAMRIIMLDTNNFVLSYAPSSTPRRGRCVLFTVSDDVVSFGNESIYSPNTGSETTGIGAPDIYGIDTERFLIVYYDIDDSSFGYSKIGIVANLGKLWNGVTITKLNGVSVSKINGL